MSKTLEEVRLLEGKETKFYHYANEAKLVNWTMTGKYQKIGRDTLNKNELSILINLESLNAILIGAKVDREDRKDRLQARYKEVVTNLFEDAA